MLTAAVFEFDNIAGLQIVKSGSACPCLLAKKEKHQD
jgi:hypothetical protein